MRGGGGWILLVYQGEFYFRDRRGMAEFKTSLLLAAWDSLVGHTQTEMFGEVPYFGVSSMNLLQRLALQASKGGACGLCPNIGIRVSHSLVVIISPVHISIFLKQI